MPFTKLDRPWVRPPFLTNHRIRQISTPRVNYNPLLLLRYLRVDAQILSTGQAQPRERFLLRLLLGRLCAMYAVRHEPLQLGQGLFDLGNGTGTVD